MSSSLTEIFSESLKVSRNVYNEIDIRPRPLQLPTLGTECKYLFEGIKFNSTYCSFHPAQYLQLNSIFSPEKRCSIFNSFIEINQAKSIGTHEEISVGFLVTKAEKEGKK
jgi:hypothetical protein